MREALTNLFSFLTESGSGVQTYILKDRLRVRSLPEASETVAIPNLRLEVGVWTFLSVVHAAGAYTMAAVATCVWGVIVSTVPDHPFFVDADQPVWRSTSMAQSCRGLLSICHTRSRSPDGLCSAHWGASTGKCYASHN